MSEVRKRIKLTTRTAYEQQHFFHQAKSVPAPAPLLRKVTQNCLSPALAVMDDGVTML